MIEALIGVVGIYLACGGLFALVFVMRGVGAVDSAAHGSGIGFRLLILPGSAALWPYLLLQWVRVRKSS